MTPLQKLQSHVQLRKTGDGYSGKCPAHDGQGNTSLHVTEGDDGRALVHCFAGCTTGAVISAMGLAMSDLMPAGNGHTPTTARATKPPPTTYHTAAEAVAALESRHGPRSALWTYHKPRGEPVGLVLRWDTTPGKAIRPVSLTARGWVHGGMPTPRPLYNLPTIALAPAATVYVVEGEKCCEALAALGLLATTSPHGSQSAAKTDWTPLANRTVVVIPDNDEPGAVYAREVAAILTGLTPPATVSLLAIPDLPPGGDVCDLIDGLTRDGAGGDARDLLMGFPITAYEPLPCPYDASSRITTTNAPSTAVQPTRLLRANYRLMSDIAPESVDWLWTGRLAPGEITMVSGDPGLGKSYMICDIIARLTAPQYRNPNTDKYIPQWPDVTDLWVPHTGSVIMLDAENSPSRTLRNRLDACGAACERVALIESVTHTDALSGTEHQAELSLATDLDAVEHVANDLRDAGHPCVALVIDPISAYLDGVDSYKNAEVRGLLKKITRFAEIHKIAVMIVNHLHKGGSGKAIYRMAMSLAFSAAPRLILAVAEDEDNPKLRLLLSAKNGLGAKPPTIAYEMRPGHASLNGYPSLIWDVTPRDITADDALSEDKGRGRPDDELQRAVDFLREALGAGPALVRDVEDSAFNGHRISKRTLDRARAELRVKTVKEPAGWTIALQ